MIIFGMGINILFRRGENARGRWNFWLLVALFIIATIVTVCDLLGNISSLYDSLNLGALVSSMSEEDTHRFNQAMV